MAVLVLGRTRLGPRTCAICRSLATRSQRRHASTSPDVYDVVTVGGGPAGLALLAALKSSPVTRHLRTALIETQDLAKQSKWSLPSDQYSNRASSLTPHSVETLEHAGAWGLVDQARVQPYNTLQVWDAGNDASLQFDWQAEAQRYNSIPRTVATMTENANLTSGLLKRIDQVGAADCLMSDTKVSSIEMGQDDPDGLDFSNWPVLTLESSSSGQSTQLAARLLVGADGFNSPVRAFAGVSSCGWDYDRHGVVATLKVANPEFLEQSGSIVAYQRFLPELGGPIAVLPLPNGYATLVWSTTTANASYLKSLSPEDFVTLVNAALLLEQADLKYMMKMNTKTPGQHEEEFQWRAKKMIEQHGQLALPQVIDVQEKSIASFPLRFRHATTLTGPRIALIGDAAHTIHPLAGQGLNLGLADARSLAETIAYSVEHGMDIGDSMALERYGSERFGKGLLMCGGVDALNWMYQLGTGDGIMANVLSGARGLGMKFFGSSLAEQTGLKGRIMKVAEGS